MVIGIIATVVILALGLALIGSLVVRGHRAATISEADFDDAYDELVAKGEIVDHDRKAAWEEFHAWQVANEEERRSWEDEADA